MPEPRPPAASAPGGHRARLRADCGRCFGLCCVAPAFSASADFAIDKGAGQACPNLGRDFRCSIHDHLRQEGFPGCAVYDCFGAGQQVAQVTFGGRDWRREPGIAGQMFQAFTIMRQLHELLWYLSEALTLPRAHPVHVELGRALDETERLTRQSPGALAELDMAAHQRDVNMLLLRASELARTGARPSGSVGGAEGDLRGADLTGKDLSGANLSGANLRGARLIGASLRGADLTGKDLSDANLSGANLRGARLIGASLRGADLRLADLTGADLRGADLGGADAGQSIFLTQSQADAAKGDSLTRLPPALTVPAHWRRADMPGHIA